MVRALRGSDPNSGYGTLLRAASDAGLAVERVHVEDVQDRFRLVDARTGARGECTSWTRDRFGRFEADEQPCPFRKFHPG
jgi:hypothetical protein